MTTQKHDPVNHPKHYTNHPSGIECIQITEHMGFNLGNALKYIWRCDLKKDAIEDLEKAKWYLEREIAKRRAEAVDELAGIDQEIAAAAKEVQVAIVPEKARKPWESNKEVEDYGQPGISNDVDLPAKEDTTHSHECNDRDQY